MSKRIAVVILVVLLTATLAVPTAFAQSATNQAWVSSITYYTPSATGGTLVVDFYPEGSATAISVGPFILAGHKAGSLFVGGISTLGNTFTGSAVLSSDVYVVATAAQFAAGSAANNYGRLLYSGFSADDTSATVYIPTVLFHAAGSTSMIAIQNSESFIAAVNVKFYAAGKTVPVANKNYTIQPQSNLILLGGGNAGGVSLPNGFSGSAVIVGTKQGAAGTPAKLVASVQETDDAGRGAYAFEGVSGGANTIYMASMQCKLGPSEQISYYAIQNTSLTASTRITIDFYNTDGVKIAAMPSTPISVGGKLSVNPCGVAGITKGAFGSAVVHSIGAPVIAIGKVKANNGMATAFVGSAAGATKIAAPYIRWAASPSSEWRSYVAIMNVGSLPAKNVVVKYFDGNGTVKATRTLASAASPLRPFIKTNTNAQAAGALQADGTFGLPTGSVPGGGAIEISSDQPLVVVVRLQRDVSVGSTTLFAEDYNGVSIP